jgi:hypothetical protein
MLGQIIQKVKGVTEGLPASILDGFVVSIAAFNSIESSFNLLIV